MKIWRIANPFDLRFAQAGLRGTWQPGTEVTPCPDCGSTRYGRISPLTVEWEEGSDVIGDFTWVSPGQDVLIKATVLDQLHIHCSGFISRPVKMIHTSNVKALGTKVRLPYQGPMIYELWITSRVHVDRRKSSMSVVAQCKSCGNVGYKVQDVEVKKHVWNKRHGALEELHFPRTPGKGLYIADSDVDGSDIFRVDEFPAWIFCRDTVKDFMTDQGFTNINFLEYGELF